MASKTPIPFEAYLRMSFDGIEPDYLDGELKERRSGSIPHFKAQKRLLNFFRSLKQSQLFGYPEVTLKITATRYRVADIAVFVLPPTGDKYPSSPPEFVIEVVSEDDRWVDIQEKLAEYHAWGIRHVWLVDPWTRKLHVYDQAGMHEVATFEAPEFAAALSAAESFSDQS